MPYSDCSRAAMTSNCSAPDDANDGMAESGLGHEHLEEAFLRQLDHGLVEAFVPHVAGPQRREPFRRELRDRRKTDLPAGIERVADRQLARIDQADDVAGVGLRNGLAVAAEEAIDAGEAQRRAEPLVRRPPCPS